MGDDPLKRYPRMLHPQVFAVLTDLYGEEPLAAQSMFYFKPPQSRGQVLHQDNYYLKVETGTCIAAWTAIDVADPDNHSRGTVLLVHFRQKVDQENRPPGFIDKSRPKEPSPWFPMVS
jgi:phytanoyl-CoA hydroxylase